MDSPKGGKSGIRRAFARMTSTEAGEDDFGVRSCVAFAISAVLLWLLIESGILGHDDPLLFFLIMAWVLAIGGAVLLGAVFALAGISRAIDERRVPKYSLIGLILNVGPSGLLYLLLHFRA